MELVVIFCNMAIIYFGVFVLFMLAGRIGVWRKHPIAPSLFAVMNEMFYWTIGLTALVFVGLLFV